MLINIEKLIEYLYFFQLVLQFKRSVSDIPHEILKWALLDSSTSPQTFYVLRCNFIRSVATMNVAQWIFGVGDRHSTNILVDTKTFNLVGIDFECAFGTGTRDLPIPELIPFRLTPQMVNVMEPMGVSGLLSRCMSHALRCFRSEKKILIACMDVFVREPTLNWKTATDTRDPNNKWDPETRVNIAYRKLSGANSLNITLQELRMNRFVSHHLVGFEQLLQSNKYYGEETDLSVDDQIVRLIAQARDEAILGITYVPWMPYI